MTNFYYIFMGFFGERRGFVPPTDQPKVQIDTGYQQEINARENPSNSETKGAISPAEMIDFAKDVLYATQDPSGDGDVPVPPGWTPELMKAAWDRAKQQLDPAEAVRIEKALKDEKYF